MHRDSAESPYGRVLEYNVKAVSEQAEAVSEHAMDESLHVVLDGPTCKVFKAVVSKQMMGARCSGDRFPDNITRTASDRLMENSL